MQTCPALQDSASRFENGQYVRAFFIISTKKHVCNLRDEFVKSHHHHRPNMKYVKYPHKETLNMGGIADYRMTGIKITTSPHRCKTARRKTAERLPRMTHAQRRQSRNLVAFRWFCPS